MSDLDGSYITLLRNAVTKLYDGTADLFAKHGDQPNRGSLIDNEIRESPRAESIVTACSIATQLIEYSGEHLTLFVRALVEPIVPLAAWTCVRSMLESCALSAWMMDPTIGHKARVARVFAYRYESLEQQLKCGRLVSGQPIDLDGILQRIDAVEQTAIALGYSPIRNSKGKRIGIGQRMPGATEIIRIMLNEEKMYRLSSAVAHGHSWAMMQLGFKPLNPAGDGATQLAGIDVHCFEKHVLVKGMAYLGLGAATAFSRPVWYLWSCMGWHLEPLAVLLDDVFDQLKAKDCTRFWRLPQQSA